MLLPLPPELLLHILQFFTPSDFFWTGVSSMPRRELIPPFFTWCYEQSIDLAKPRMSFGKHRGEKIETLPLGYLHYIHGLPNKRQGTKVWDEIARELKKRKTSACKPSRVLLG